MRRTTWGWEFICEDCGVVVQQFGNGDKPTPVCATCHWLATQTDSAVKEAFRRITQPEEQQP